MLTRICAILFVALGLFTISGSFVMQAQASSSPRELMTVLGVILGTITLATGLILNAIAGARRWWSNSAPSWPNSPSPRSHLLKPQPPRVPPSIAPPPSPSQRQPNFPPLHRIFPRPPPPSSKPCATTTATRKTTSAAPSASRKCGNWRNPFPRPHPPIAAAPAPGPRSPITPSSRRKQRLREAGNPCCRNNTHTYKSTPLTS